MVQCPMKNIMFIISLFRTCLLLIELSEQLIRILCFQKRCKVRINFDWKELWSSLILLLKFLLNNEAYFFKQQQQQQQQQQSQNKINLFTVMQQTITIFNMFILYGDNFLHNVHCYDELYYEIIRMHAVFDNLNLFALRHMTKQENNTSIGNTNNKYKEESNKLTNNLINIKAIIIAHLNMKLESYSQQNKMVTLSKQQVLDIVRNNYDTLTLKLQENLDSYESYNFAKSNEIDFFNQILHSIIEDFTMKKSFIIHSDEQHNLIQELQFLQFPAITLCSTDNNDDDNVEQQSSPGIANFIESNHQISSSSSFK
ncbi:hypothetical protein DERF_006559 [Dermatophagoides farinae]|nr:hypothetical protein DERF_006559 [Dermatophagoides farinae]